MENKKQSWEKMLDSETLYLKNGVDREILKEVNEAVLKKDVIRIIKKAQEEEREKIKHINEINIQSLINERIEIARKEENNKLKEILREIIRKYNLKNPNVSIKSELEEMRNLLMFEKEVEEK